MNRILVSYGFLLHLLFATHANAILNGAPGPVDSLAYVAKIVEYEYRGKIVKSLGYCTGTVIASHVVLTSRHCLFDRTAEPGTLESLWNLELQQPTKFVVWVPDRDRVATADTEGVRVLDEKVMVRAGRPLPHGKQYSLADFDFPGRDIFYQKSDKGVWRFRKEPSAIADLIFAVPHMFSLEKPPLNAASTDLALLILKEPIPARPLGLVDNGFDWTTGPLGRSYSYQSERLPDFKTFFDTLYTLWIPSKLDESKASYPFSGYGFIDAKQSKMATGSAHALFLGTYQSLEIVPRQEPPSVLRLAYPSGSGTGYFLPYRDKASGPRRIQPADSGGPVFSGGKLGGVISSAMTLEDDPTFFATIFTRDSELLPTREKPGGLFLRSPRYIAEMQKKKIPGFTIEPITFATYPKADIPPWLDNWLLDTKEKKVLPMRQLATMDWIEGRLKLYPPPGTSSSRARPTPLDRPLALAFEYLVPDPEHFSPLYDLMGAGVSYGLTAPGLVVHDHCTGPSCTLSIPPTAQLELLPMIGSPNVVFSGFGADCHCNELSPTAGRCTIAARRLVARCTLRFKPRAPSSMVTTSYSLPIGKHPLFKALAPPAVTEPIPTATPTPVASAPKVPTPVASAPKVPTPVASAPKVATPVVSAPKVPTPVVSAPKVPTPVVSAPTITDPATTAPTITDPATTALTSIDPTTTAPTITDPATTAPTITDPATTAPTITDPATTAPTIIDPATTAPGASGPCPALVAATLSSTTGMQGISQPMVPGAVDGHPRFGFLVGGVDRDYKQVLVRYDSAGRVIALPTLPKELVWISAVSFTDDGGALVAGYTAAGGLLLVDVSDDASRSLSWQPQVNGQGVSYALVREIFPLPNGTYLLTGTANLPGGGLDGGARTYPFSLVYDRGRGSLVPTGGNLPWGLPAELSLPSLNYSSTATLLGPGETVLYFGTFPIIAPPSLGFLLTSEGRLLARTDDSRTRYTTIAATRDAANAYLLAKDDTGPWIEVLSTTSLARRSSLPLPSLTAGRWRELMHANGCLYAVAVDQTDSWITAARHFSPTATDATLTLFAARIPTDSSPILWTKQTTLRAPLFSTVGTRGESLVISVEAGAGVVYRFQTP